MMKNNIEITTQVSKDTLISALRQLTINKDYLDPTGWSQKDVDDLRLIANCIERELKERQQF